MATEDGSSVDPVAVNVFTRRTDDKAAVMVLQHIARTLIYGNIFIWSRP